MVQDTDLDIILRPYSGFICNHFSSQCGKNEILSLHESIIIPFMTTFISFHHFFKPLLVLTAVCSVYSKLYHFKDAIQVLEGWFRGQEHLLSLESICLGLPASTWQFVITSIMADQIPSSDVCEHWIKQRTYTCIQMKC